MLKTKRTKTKNPEILVAFGGGEGESGKNIRELSGVMEIFRRDVDSRNVSIFQNYMVKICEFKCMYIEFKKRQPIVMNNQAGVRERVEVQGEIQMT